MKIKLARLITANAALLSLLLGCSPVADDRSTEAKPVAVEKPAVESKLPMQFQTPELCWTAMINAQKDNDSAAAFQCLAQKDRNLLLGSLAFQVQQLSSFKTPVKEAATDLLKRHGLADIDIMGEMQIADSPRGGGIENVFAVVAEKIEAQSSFVKEAEELLSKELPKAKAKAQTPLPQLSNVAIAGDSATATVSTTDLSKTKTIHFVKEDGSWRVSRARNRTTP